MLAELDRVGRLTKGRQLVSVFFGGGTPSLMKPSLCGALLSRLSAYWSLADDLEITLEANPNSSDANNFRQFRAAGVNRLSLGIQSLRPESLKFLGRLHGRDEALRAIETAASLFPRYSFDLIYALPGMDITPWEIELNEGITLAGDHLSLYQLTIEPGTAFHTAHARGDFTLPSPDESAILYTRTEEIMNANGFGCYEVSNYARPGGESRHNLTYWRYDDYAGIGPGAHGRLTIQGQKIATTCYRAPETWLKHVLDGASGNQDESPLTPAICFEEALMMGLRLTNGVSIAALTAIDGTLTAGLLTGSNLKTLMDENLLTNANNRIIPTKEGLLKLSSVLAFLLSNRG